MPKVGEDSPRNGAPQSLRASSLCRNVTEHKIQLDSLAYLATVAFAQNDDVSSGGYGHAKLNKGRCQWKKCITEGGESCNCFRDGDAESGAGAAIIAAS